MAYALVSGQSVCSVDSTNSTTASVVFPVAATNGNIVTVLAVSTQTAVVSTVSDAGSTTFTKQKEVQNGTQTVSIWSGKAASATATHTITWSVKGSQKETAIAEFSGNPSTIALDGTPGSASGAASDTDPARTGNVSTSDANALVVGAICCSGSLGTEPTLGSGWNRIGTYNNSREYAAYKIETSTESAGTNMATSTSRSWVGAVVAFTAAVTATPFTPPNHSLLMTLSRR